MAEKDAKKVKVDKKTGEILVSSDLNIFQKINMISSEVGKIEKTGRNTNQNYNFIEQAVVVSIIKGLLDEHGVSIIPSVDDHQVISKEKGAKIIVHLTFTVVNTDNVEDRLICHWVGEGDDSLDKGTTKALTSAQKYFYMKLFNISDKDDPDAEGKDLGKMKTEKPTVVAKTTEKSEAPQTEGKPATESQLKLIDKMLGELGEEMDADQLKDLTIMGASKIINDLMAKSRNKQ